VPHDELDWAPLGVSDSTAFVNLMTSRVESVADELSDLAASHIKAGEWPWSFFCLGEGRPRVVFPSAFRLLAPAPGGRIGIAVQCPVCGTVSVNLVSREHVDVPFVNDREVGVAEHVASLQVEKFRAQLASDAFDARRLELE
jgi:hypothetical protein